MALRYILIGQSQGLFFRTSPARGGGVGKVCAGGVRSTGPSAFGCPSGCGGPSLYAPGNPHRPFCSERCRNHDLGAWASESYTSKRAPIPTTRSDHRPARVAASSPALIPTASANTKANAPKVSDIGSPLAIRSVTVKSR